MTARSNKRKSISWSSWLVPIGLLFLTLIPSLGGAVRLSQLINGVEVTSENARFFESPLPVVLHIITVSLYSVLGAFQFSPRLRNWKRGWHKNIGRLLVPAGLISAMSGIWMTQFYDLPAMDGEIFGLLYWMRMSVGVGMIASIMLAVNALREREYREHGAWMIRAYALGMGAGTQAFTHIPWFIVGGRVGYSA